MRSFGSHPPLYYKVNLMKALPRLLLLVLLVVPAAFAQTSVTLSGQTASATVLQGLSLVNNTPLTFGRIVNGATAGTAVLTAPGVFSTTGGVTAPAGNGATAASFTVTGSAGTTLTITIPATITLTGPGPSMTVTTVNNAGTNPVALGGTLTFGIGGSMAVAANQTGGAYSGTYAVTVAYN
jgi:Domain of unknown function (DUF4402)